MAALARWARRPRSRRSTYSRIAAIPLEYVVSLRIGFELPPLITMLGQCNPLTLGGLL
jgi:hypothetical protein